MALTVAFYGKGGIGKSTVTSNCAAAFGVLGKKVLQIGCDPKHDSTYPITHTMIPTVIDTLSKHDFHYERIVPEEIIFSGYNGIDAIEVGGPPAGTGCGGYAIGETVQLLNNLEIFSRYDVVLFDILGDVVCGGFSIPLHYAKYVCIVATEDFDSLFAANRIASAVCEKAKLYPVRLAGIVANRCTTTKLIQQLCTSVNIPIISTIPDAPSIRKARISGKTIFESAESDRSLEPLTLPYLTIAKFLPDIKELPNCKPIADREMFEAFLRTGG